MTSGLSWTLAWSCRFGASSPHFWYKAAFTELTLSLTNLIFFIKVESFSAEDLLQKIILSRFKQACVFSGGDFKWNSFFVCQQLLTNSPHWIQTTYFEFGDTKTLKNVLVVAPAIFSVREDRAGTAWNSEKCQSCFFAPKIGALTDFPASETSSLEK